MYFTKFPLIEYLYRDNKNNVMRTKLATNILRRVGFSGLSQMDKSVFITYHVKDGETAEIIAHKLYNDSEFHWLVLLFNNIVHPYHDWPLSNLALDEYIEDKYSGVSLFLSDGDDEHPNTINFYQNQTVAPSNGGVDNNGVYIVKNGRARVKGWDTQYSRLDIDVLKDDVELIEAFREGDYVVGIGSTGESVIGKIHRRTYGTEAVHHFERKEKGSSGDYVWLNPLGSSELTGQIPLGSTGFTFDTDGTGGGGENFHETGPIFSQTVLGSYMGISGSNNNDNLVTNRVYEIRLNDDKKEIKLLHPKYTGIVMEEFTKLMTVEGLIS